MNTLYVKMRSFPPIYFKYFLIFTFRKFKYILSTLYFKINIDVSYNAYFNQSRIILSGIFGNYFQRKQEEVQFNMA